MRITKEKSNYDIDFLKLLNLRNAKYTSKFLEEKLKNMLLNEIDYNMTLLIDIKNLYIKKKKYFDNKYSNIVDIGNNLVDNLVNNSYTNNNFYSFSFTSVNDYSQNLIATIDLSGNNTNTNNNLQNFTPTLDLSFNEIVTDNDTINDLFSSINASNKNMISSSTLHNIIREFKILNYNLDNEGYQVKTITI